ncbi:MAG: hypothetical protein PWP09_1368 [Thermotogota bacterium]|nr:hypothetical protein [Thermotogota bacterium]
MKRLVLLVFLLMASFGLSLTVINEMESVAGINDDNTGARFSLSDEYVYAGKYAVKVTPSGKADETKLAFQLSGEALEGWMESDLLKIAVFIPKVATTYPDRYFLGMADVTEGWSWVDGVFSETLSQSGWNEITFKLSPRMKEVSTTGKYMLYFAFIDFEDGSKKVPMVDAFYVDHFVALPSEEEKVRLYVFPMETEEELERYGNDNTGAVFELSDRYVSQGLNSMKIKPNGEAIETKVALPLEGEAVEKWIQGNTVKMRVYLPSEMRVLPTMYFLGMADVTAEWKWVGGVFADASNVTTGWNELSFEIAGPMKDLDPAGRYIVYLAFAGFDEKNQKIPLVDAFYIDGIYVEKTKVLTLEDRVAMADPMIKKEVEKMLNMEGEELLDYIQKKTFDYFWNEVNPSNGLVRDRSTKDSPCSIAAVGFALTAIPIGIERGWISYDEGYQRVLTTLKTFVEGKVEGKNGFFYHFVDMNTGKRVWNCELSSIDTSLLIAGALFAGEYFAGTEVEKLAEQLYRNVDWQWMMADDGTLYMGWKPEGGFLNAKWDSFNEGILAYVLAIGSPTHPIPAESWDKILRPVHENYISCPTESLFVYQYPSIWVDFRDKEDKYANYFNNARVATRYNYLFCVMNRFKYKTYDFDVWGLSACDGPAGYKHYGASEGNHDGTVAPYSAISSIVFTPDLSMKAIKGMLNKYGPLVWGRYGFVSGFNVDANWFSDQYVGIDQGDVLLMIENHRTGFVWRHFMKNEYVQSALNKIGFVNKVADYAVTPWYQQKYQEMVSRPSEKVIEASRVTGIAVDGNLEDWRDVPYGIVDEDMNVRVPGIKPVDKRSQILHSHFYVAWDDEYLYLAARVYDEYVVVNIAPDDLGAFYRTDSIEFYVDPSRANPDAGIFKLAVLPFDTEGNVQAVRHEDANPGPVAKVAPEVKVASKRTENGYIVEAAIPFKYLGITPREGLEVGFCHTVHNSNKRDAKQGEYVRENIISWVPVADVWASPEIWGTLRFVK